MRRLFGLAAACVFAYAQNQAAKPVVQQPLSADDEASRIVMEVTRVNVLFSVSDKKNRFITDLTKDQFEVLEGKAKQNIIEFVRESDLPLRLAILVDTSNSIRDRFRFQQEAALEFLRSIMRPEKDKAIVVGFDTSFALAADLTSNMAELERGIRQMRPGGGTALYDAVYFSSLEKLSKDQPRHKFRRAMIVLSDGDDNASRYSRDQALEAAHKADVVVYTISTNISRVQSSGDKVLNYFAIETGGLMYLPFKVEDLTQHFENIANELRHQYSIVYRPEPLRTDGLYHPVEVRVKGLKNVIVRARKGYYAPKM